MRQVAHFVTTYTKDRRDVKAKVSVVFCCCLFNKRIILLVKIGSEITGLNYELY